MKNPLGGDFMQLWQDGLVALLAVIGLASLLWMAVTAILYAPPRRSPQVLALISAQGDGETLEDQVRDLERLRQERHVIGRVLLVDCGLSDQGRRLAELLARERRYVTLCRREELDQYI
jgi:hypothetical protein